MTLVHHANSCTSVLLRHANGCTWVLAIRMLPTMSLPLGACHIFMQAVEKVLEEELFEVESQYTSAVVKLHRHCRIGGKKFPPNWSYWESFPTLLRLSACYACCRSTLQMRRERMWGSYHRLRSAEPLFMIGKVMSRESSYWGNLISYERLRRRVTSRESCCWAILILGNKQQEELLYSAEREESTSCHTHMRDCDLSLVCCPSREAYALHSRRETS